MKSKAHQAMTSPTLTSVLVAAQYQPIDGDRQKLQDCTDDIIILYLQGSLVGALLPPMGSPAAIAAYCEMEMRLFQAKTRVDVKSGYPFAYLSPSSCMGLPVEALVVLPA